MQKQSLKSLAKIVTLGLVLGTALTATSSVWAAEPHVVNYVVKDSTSARDVFKYIYSYADDDDYKADSLAFGINAKANKADSIALGKNSHAYFQESVALGVGSRAGGNNSFAAMGGTTGGNWNADYTDFTPKYDGTDGKWAIAIGTEAKAIGDDSVAIGTYAQATNIPKRVGDTYVTEFAVGGGELCYDGDTVTAYARITGVADGVNDHDAATYGQLTSMGQELNSQIDRMGTRIDKVGAGAAALAAMHPVYDEDSKLTFSAGLGAYRGEQAAAVGMFYRFTDRVMMNAGATVGNNDNMYNVGLNFALDRSVGSKLPSKAVMSKQLNAQNERIDALTAENQDMKKEIAELKVMVQVLIANKQ